MDVFEHIAIHKPTLTISELLLLDIARSLHRHTELAEEGLKFSHSLATLMGTDVKVG